MALPFMPFYWGDYWRDTAHLSDAEHVSYLRLLSHYWQHESLPTDDDRLARIAGRSRKDWLKMRVTLAAFFTAKWKHERVERDLEKQKRARELAREKASRAANARWAEQSIKQCLEHSSEQCFGNANHNHNQNNNNIYTKKGSRSSSLGSLLTRPNAEEMDEETKQKISAQFSDLSKSLGEALQAGRMTSTGELLPKKRGAS